MLPPALRQAIITGQRRDIQTEIRRALHVAMPAEDVGPGTRRTDVAGRQQQVAIGAHVRRADRVLRAAHAPDEGRRLLRREGLGDPLEVRLRNAGDALDLGRIVLLHLLADLVHSPDALADELLILPAVLEDVPHDPPDDGDVGARAHADVIRRVRRRPGEARIDDDDVRAVGLLARQDVLERDRMRLGRVRPHEDDGLGVADVVVAVGHGAVAPCVRHSRDRRRVADARLVVDVVGAPERRELAEQIRALVRELGRAEQIDAVGPAGLADRQHLVADLVDGLVPRDADPLAVFLLHRIFQAAVAVDDLTDRRALGAMGAAVDRAVPGGLLTDPDAVLDLGLDRAADRAMRADVGFDLDGLAEIDHSGLGLADRAGTERPKCGQTADGEAGRPEERPTVDGFRRDALREAGEAAPGGFG